MLADHEKSEIKNSNALSSIENRKTYELHFDEVTDGKIRVFCEVFDLELNNFIVNTVKDDLYVIGANIHQNDYDTIGKYYDVSKLVGVQPRSVPHKEPEKNVIVEAEFPLLISGAIECLCDKIPLTAEEYIVDLVNEEICILIDNIKDRCYDFLGKYKDFSKIEKTINRFYEEDPL